MKGFITYQTYKTKNKKSFVFLFGRLENNQTFVTINEFQPYFFIKTKDKKQAERYLKSFEVKDTNLKTIKEEKLTKITLQTPDQVPRLRKIFEEHSILSYEADIKLTNRFLIDNKIQGSLEIDGDYTSEGLVDRIYHNPDIKPSDHLPKLKILSLDIETDREAKEIYCISLYTDNFKKVLINSNKKLKNIINCSSEEDLLHKFIKQVQQIDPDIITGWSLIDFDLKVIFERLKKYKIKPELGRDNSNCKLRIETSFFRDSKANFPGRQVLDGIHLLKSSFIKLDNYKLDTAAEVFLNQKKLIGDKGDKGETIENYYKNNQQKLVDYNLKDAELVYKILEKTNTINLAIKRSLLAGMPLNKVSATIGSLDSLYLKKARDRKYVLPSNIFTQRTDKGVGGFVMEPQPGIYDNILVFDFKSLYPSVIRTFNIDPIAMDAKDSLSSPAGINFKKELAILPEIIQKLWEARQGFRKKGDETGREAVKVLMNCFTPDTLIMTKQGVKFIEEIKEGDLVYTLNPDTLEVEYSKVTKTFSYYYEGEMIKIQNQHTLFKTTPNHRFFIKYGDKYVWKEAEQIYKRKKDFWFPPHPKIKGKKYKFFDIKKYCDRNNITYRLKGDLIQKSSKHSSIPSKFRMKDWLEFLGWFISEGFVYVSKPKRYPGKVSWRGISHNVKLSQKNKEGRDKILSLVKRMGLKCSLELNGINISNQILAEVLLKECGNGSYSKKLPKWVFDLDYILLEGLYSSLMEGDGDKRGRRYTTVSETLANDFLRLCHHLGFSAYIHIEGSFHRINITKKRGNGPHMRHKRISKYNYCGPVMCVEVPPHHTILAGSETKMHWCGQSFYGALASPLSRYFNRKLGNSITLNSQFFVKDTARLIKEKGYEVIYGDTDSIFVISKAKSLKQAQERGKKLEKEINQHYTKWIKKEFKRDSVLELEFEKVYTKFLMPKLRHAQKGAKKRYAGLKNGKIEVIGMEFVRSDWTELAKKYQKEILERVFKDKDITKFTKKYIEDIRKGKYDNLLIYRKSIRKDLSSYTKTSPPHVKAARKLKKLTSSKIEYVLTTDGPEPIQNQKHKPDYEHYIEKQIKPIATTILTLLNKKFEEVIKGHKQSSLADF